MDAQAELDRQVAIAEGKPKRARRRDFTEEEWAEHQKKKTRERVRKHRASGPKVELTEEQEAEALSADLADFLAERAAGPLPIRQ